MENKNEKHKMQNQVALEIDIAKGKSIIQNSNLSASYNWQGNSHKLQETWTGEENGRSYTPTTSVLNVIVCKTTLEPLYVYRMNSNSPKQKKNGIIWSRIILRATCPGRWGNRPTSRRPCCTGPESRAPHKCQELAIGGLFHSDATWTLPTTQANRRGKRKH